jgi:hypothetical protein
MITRWWINWEIKENRTLVEAKLSESATSTEVFGF